MYMWGELERYLRQLGMTRDEFVRALSQTGKHSSGGNAVTLSPTVCTHCNDDYSHLAGGLVEPACIAVAECVKTAHDSDCVCDNIARINIPSDDHSDCTGRCETDDDNGSDTDENVEFFDAQPQMFSDIDFEGKYSHDVFNDIATLLYSAQGRERLCSTCFLLKEKYIGEDGLAADFPPMPTGFQGLRVKW